MKTNESTLLLAVQDEQLRNIIEKWAKEHEKSIYYFTQKGDFMAVPAQMIIMQEGLESGNALGVYAEYCREVNSNAKHFDDLDLTPLVFIRNDGSIWPSEVQYDSRNNLAKQLAKPISRVEVIDVRENSLSDLVDILNQFDRYFVEEEQLKVNGKRRISVKHRISTSPKLIEGLEDLINQLKEKGYNRASFKYSSFFDDSESSYSDFYQIDEIPQEMLNWLHLAEYGKFKFIEVL